MTHYVDGIRKRLSHYTTWSRTVRQARTLAGYKLSAKDFVRQWRGMIELAQLYNLGACYGFSEQAIEDELFRIDDRWEDDRLAAVVERCLS